MKKCLFLLFIAIGQFAFAQQIDVKSIQLLKGTEQGGCFHPVFSPDGAYLLSTAENYAGLKQHNLATAEVVTVTTDAGAGYGVRISPDANTVLFKKTEMKNNLRYTSLQQYSLSDKKQVRLTDAMRENVSPVFIGERAAFIKDNSLMKVGKTSNKVAPYINVEEKKMVLYSGNTRHVLTPNGEDKSYFWASVSPDSKHIVYTAAAYGTFVCNIDGSNVVSLGKLNAPVWLNNQWVIGMNDQDNGDRVITSEIVAATIDGGMRHTFATPMAGIAMYPSVSADGNKIAFNTEKGEIYIIDIQIN